MLHLDPDPLEPDPHDPDPPDAKPHDLNLPDIEPPGPPPPNCHFLCAPESHQNRTDLTCFHLSQQQYHRRHQLVHTSPKLNRTDNLVKHPRYPIL